MKRALKLPFVVLAIITTTTDGCRILHVWKRAKK